MYVQEYIYTSKLPFVVIEAQVGPSLPTPIAAHSSTAKTEPLPRDRLVFEQVESTVRYLYLGDATYNMTRSHRPSTGTIRHEAARALSAGPLVAYLRYFVPHFLLRLLAMSGTLVISTPGSPTRNSDPAVVPMSFVRSMRTELSLQFLRAYAR